MKGAETMRKIAKSELNSLFAAIAERAKLYVPQDTAGGAKFSEWKNGKKCSAALNTVLQCKRLFLSADRKPDGF